MTLNFKVHQDADIRISFYFEDILDTCGKMVCSYFGITLLISVNDPRFSGLRNVFLKYFQDWLNSVEQRQGNFTKDTRQKMFISSQTCEALKITVNSIIEPTQFLLQHQVKYGLTKHFCQDLLENYFGRKRSLGSRKDYPSMADFGYNYNAIRKQKIFNPIAQGKVADCGMVALIDEPLPC